MLADIAQNRVYVFIAWFFVKVILTWCKIRNGTITILPDVHIFMIL